jgi:AmmeMemoRadiSam system protein A
MGKHTEDIGDRPMSTPTPLLTPEQRAHLLTIARRAIRDRVTGCAATDPTPADATLGLPGAAFVTLTRRGALRGCIGYVQAVTPLATAIAHCAAAAAMEDPRFPAVTARELPELSLELSILSPLRPITDPTEVQVGLHGLYVSRGRAHGLLLPQVATEHGWDRATFLRQACLKAGLPADAWQRGAALQVFTVERVSDGKAVGAETA